MENRLWSWGKRWELRRCPLRRWYRCWVRPQLRLYGKQSLVILEMVWRGSRQLRVCVLFGLRDLKRFKRCRCRIPILNHLGPFWSFINGQHFNYFHASDICSDKVSLRWPYCSVHLDGWSTLKFCTRTLTFSTNLCAGFLCMCCFLTLLPN